MSYTNPDKPSATGKIVALVMLAGAILILVFVVVPAFNKQPAPVAKPDSELLAPAPSPSATPGKGGKDAASDKKVSAMHCPVSTNANGDCPAGA